MARARRPNLPGTPFHLTARIQWQEPLLVELRPVVVRLIHEEAGNADMRVVAYAVMANHLHIVAVQGRHPLGWFMQALLRRVALKVMRHHGREGHVFQRRFYARPCSVPSYLRTMIAYVHLNPVRAGICARPDDFSWSSHGSYAMAGEHCPSSNDESQTTPVMPAAFELTVESAVRLFSAADDDSLDACRQAYRSYQPVEKSGWCPTGVMGIFPRSR